MRRSNKILRVPSDPKLRNLLRKEAAILVGGAKLLPPADFDSLEYYASRLIRSLNASDDHLDFAIVLVGNETWRSIVAATPFNRRLLLLPQCLKDSNGCKGTFDDLGLLCAGCKGCVITDILDEAEQLGYTTLVAEGTTVAIGLVEEGSIDAVIGVSCMPVLQRSFEKVTNAAVPVIGLPLMYDGCTNTNIDYGWLQDEIRAFAPNEQLRPLSVSLLKSQVQEYFSEAGVERFFPGSGMIEKLAREVMSRGGQRMRPLLTVLAYLAYAEQTEEDLLIRLAMIIECFHKASLLHDDVEDNSDLRYSRETLHKTHGIPVAINMGDYLIGKGYELLSGMPSEPGKTVRCLRVIAGSHIGLTRGQGADITLDPFNPSFTTEQACEIFRLKTSEAIKVALLLGAIAGGAPEEELLILDAFADAFGIAYQIRDDLHEFREKNENEKIIDFPFLVALLNENRNIKEGENSQPGREVPVMSEFRQQVEDQQLDKKAVTVLQSYIENCYHHLDRLRNQRLRLSCYGVMGKIFKWSDSDE